MSYSLSRRTFLKAAAVSPLALYGCGGGSSVSSGGGGGTRSASYAWTKNFLDTVSALRSGPPQTARAAAIVATAAFDAWACYDAVAIGTRLGGQLRRPASERTLANKTEAISYAVYRVLVDIFPARKAELDAALTAQGYNPSDNTTDTSTPRGIGNRVAAALLQFRHADGSNQLNAYADTTGYVPVNTADTVTDPSRWQRLRFANGASPAALVPHWKNVIPFALTSPSVLRPAAPPAYGSPTYRAQAQEIVDLTANLTDERKVIAEYWADGPGTVTPPGHWHLFGLFISERDAHTLDQDVQMFFMLGNAVFDASIACWECKFFYDTSRPITAIRNLYAGQQIRSYVSPTAGFQTVDGAQWLPYQSPNFITPPFPEYASGHSTFSASGAEILKRFTGSDRFNNSVTVAAGSNAFEQNVPAQPVTLSWATFTNAADQAGISRRYGGIHFEPGDVEARRCGRLVAEAVWNKAMSHIDGSAASRDIA